MAYDIRAAVRAALEESTEPDPAVIAEAIARGVPSAHLRAALASVLPAYVTNCVTAHRFSPAKPAEGEPRSRRREAAGRILLTRIYTGEKWKHLRDCTRTDLLNAAEARRVQADGLIAHADRLDALAELMKQRSAATVAGLPDDLVRQALAGEAVAA